MRGEVLRLHGLHHGVQGLAVQRIDDAATKTLAC
jgi:hypothetical protein